MIYEPASVAVCPQCQTPPPAATAVVETPPIRPTLEVKLDPVMLDSDRKKRPFLYLSVPKKFLTPKRIILSGGLVLVLGWLVFRTRPEPIPPGPHGGAVQQVAAATVATEAPAMVAAPNDLGARIASAKPGATITLPAGTYRGSFTIDRAIHLVGDTTAGPVIIQNEKAVGIAIKAENVVLENLTITADGGGEFAAVKVFAKSSAQLLHCVIDTPGLRGVFATGGKILATGTTFGTRGQGSGCQLEDGAYGELTECIFQNNRWGYSVFTTSEGKALKCQFRQNGQPNGDGTCAGVEGEKSYLLIDEGTFEDNPAGLIANKSGRLLMTGSTLRRNGVPAEADKTATSIVGVRQAGQVIIQKSHFDSNLRGMVVSTGSRAQIEDCTFTKNGIAGPQKQGLYFSHTLGIWDEGTKVLLFRTTIDQSILNGINIIDGANLEMEEVRITGSGLSGLAAGSNDQHRTEVAAVGCHFTGSKNDGINVFGDTVVKVTSSTIAQNGRHGALANGGKVAFIAEECDITDNREAGVLSDKGTFTVLSQSSILRNKYGAQSGGTEGGNKDSITLNHCTVSGNTAYGVIANSTCNVILDNSLVTKNKQNQYQAKGAVILETSNGSKPGRLTEDTKPKTGGMTGMEATPPAPNPQDAEPESKSPQKKERPSSTSNAKRPPSGKKPTPSPSDKAQEILRKVLRFVPR